MEQPNATPRREACAPHVASQPDILDAVPLYDEAWRRMSWRRHLTPQPLDRQPSSHRALSHPAPARVILDLTSMAPFCEPFASP